MLDHAREIEERRPIVAIIALVAALAIGGGLGYEISHAHEIGIIQADNAAITKLTNDGYVLNTQLSDSELRLRANQDFLQTHYVDSHGNWREIKTVQHGK